MWHTISSFYYYTELNQSQCFLRGEEIECIICFELLSTAFTLCMCCVRPCKTTTSSTQLVNICLTENIKLLKIMNDYEPWVVSDHTHRQRRCFQMGCHSEEHHRIPCYVAYWASSLWALCQTVELHHDTQLHSHLSAHYIEKQK